MKLALLLSAAAAACIAWPAATLADPPSGQGADQGQQGQDKAKGQDHQTQSGHKGRDAAQGGQTGAARTVAPGAARDASANVPTPAAPKLGRARAFTPQGPTGASPPDTSATARFRSLQPQPGAALTGPRHTQARRAFQPPADQGALARWSPGVTGQARDRAGQQWRQSNSGWDSHARWRGNSDWWRGDDAFRGFNGVRFGFFFVPELGYVSAPAEYRERQWQAGEDLPSWFWRYGVNDYWTYGLPQPPDGCEWVWVNDDVALIDRSDGYILDIEHNVW